MPLLDPEKLEPAETTQKDRLIEQLQQELADERHARREDLFIFIVVGVLLLDIVFFSVQESFGGPLALLVLQLLILVPLAKRMGMSEIATILDRLLSRMTDRITGKARGEEE